MKILKVSAIGIISGTCGSLLGSTLINKHSFSESWENSIMIGALVGLFFMARELILSNRASKN